jgi:hypothetical protein
LPFFQKQVFAICLKYWGPNYEEQSFGNNNERLVKYGDFKQCKNFVQEVKIAGLNNNNNKIILISVISTARDFAILKSLHPL